MIAEVFQTVTKWYMGHISYGTVILLMAIESSFIPFPSEIVIPPAAWKAAQGDMNLILVVLSGTLGALIGALFNYYISLFLGRTIIYKLADTRFAHFFLIDRKGVEKAEAYFLRFGNSSTFIGRLVPAVRQLISIPAGLSRMKLKNFLLYTFLGSALWNTILAALGYFLYTKKELLDRYYKEISWLFIILGILFVVYFIYKVVKLGKNKFQK
ncbi:MAG: DedA family protein [Candidatus Methanofastidiosa archaeon]|nr:DedA family protein [Candidatus Methanofastidiosa archaeon]